MIKIMYLIVDVPSSYNIIIGRLNFNLISLGTFLSTLYLRTKYPLNNGRIYMIQRDQDTIDTCYKHSLRIKSVAMEACVAP